MDLVYILGKQSFWQNQEIKFSLRSAEKYLKFDRVFIIGKKPEFFNDKVIEIPANDDKGHKYFNVASKIGLMLQNKEISENFIYMNDDFFILQDYEKIPYYYTKTLEYWTENWKANKGKYYKKLLEIYKVFPEGKFFEIHFPIIYNKKKALKIYKKYNLSIVAVMMRSYYCNEYISEIKSEKTKDYKIYTYDHFMAYKNAPFISTTNDSIMISELKNFIISRFGKKSTYEK